MFSVSMDRCENVTFQSNLGCPILRFLGKVKNWHPFVVFEYRMFSVMVNSLLEFAFFNVWDSCVDPQGPRDWKNLELGFCLGRQRNGVEGRCAGCFQRRRGLSWTQERLVIRC